MVREVNVDILRTPARPSAASSSRSSIRSASSSRLPIPVRSTTTRKRPVLGESHQDNLTPRITSTTKRKLGPPSRSRYSQPTKSPMSLPTPGATLNVEMTNTFDFGGDQAMLMDEQPPSSIHGLSSPPDETTARFTVRRGKYVRGSTVGESGRMTPLPSQEIQEYHTASTPPSVPRASRLPTPPASSPETSPSSARSTTRPAPTRPNNSLSSVYQLSSNPRKRKSSKSTSPDTRGKPIGSVSPLNRADVDGATPRAKLRTKSPPRPPSTVMASKRATNLTHANLDTPHQLKSKPRAIPNTAPAASRKPRQSSSKSSPKPSSKSAPRRRHSTPHSNASRRKSVTPLAMQALSGRKLGILEEVIPTEPGEDPLLLKGPREEEARRWKRRSSATRKKLEDASRQARHEEMESGPSTQKRSPPREAVARDSTRYSSRQSSPQHGSEPASVDFGVGGFDFDAPMDVPDAWDSGASDGEVDESHVGQDTFLHVLERNGAATSTPRRTARSDDESRRLSVSPVVDQQVDILPVQSPLPNPPPSPHRTANPGVQHAPSPAHLASPAPSVGQPLYNDDADDDSVIDDADTTGNDTVIAEEDSFFGSSSTVIVQEQAGESLESIEEVETSMVQFPDDGEDLDELRNKAVDFIKMAVFEKHDSAHLFTDQSSTTVEQDGVDLHTPSAEAVAKAPSPQRSVDDRDQIVSEAHSERESAPAEALDDSIRDCADQSAENLAIFDRPAPVTPEISFKRERSRRRSMSRMSFTYELVEKEDPVPEEYHSPEPPGEPKALVSWSEPQESVNRVSSAPSFELEHQPTDDELAMEYLNEDAEELFLNNRPTESSGDGHDSDYDEENMLNGSLSGTSMGDVTMEANGSDWNGSEGSSESEDVPLGEVNSVEDDSAEEAQLNEDMEEDMADVSTEDLPEPDDQSESKSESNDDVAMEESEQEANAMPLEPAAPIQATVPGPPPNLSAPVPGSGSSTLNADSMPAPTEPSEKYDAESQAVPTVPERICLKLVFKDCVKVEPVTQPAGASTTTVPAMLQSATNQHNVPANTAVPTESPVEAPAAPPLPAAPPKASLPAEPQPSISGAEIGDTSFQSNTSLASTSVVDTPTPAPTTETARPIRPLPPVFRFPRTNSPRGVSTSPIELMHSSRVKQPSRLSQFVTASTSASPEKPNASMSSTTAQQPLHATSLVNNIPDAPAAARPVASRPVPAKLANAPGLYPHTSVASEASGSLGLSGMGKDRSTSSSGSSSHPATSAASSSFRSLADEMATSSSGGISSWHPFDTSLIEVSSLDPRAAARAAAILKINHAYVQDGLLPSTPSAASIPLPMTPSTTTSTRGRRRTPRQFKSPFFETIELSRQLNEDELLHEAELEIVASRRHRSRSRARNAAGDGYASDATEVDLPGGWLSSAKKRKRSMATVRPTEKQLDYFPPSSVGTREQRPWGVREWKKLEKVYRSERAAWEHTQDAAASLSNSWLSWASSKLSVSTSDPSEWHPEKVVKRFIEMEHVEGHVGEWAENVIRLRVNALEKRMHRKRTANGIAADDDREAKRRRLDLETPNRSDLGDGVSIPPPSTIQRMFNSLWSLASSTTLADTIAEETPPMASSQTLQAITSDPVYPPIPDDQSELSSSMIVPAMRQLDRPAATMSTPIKFQPAHPSSPAWSPALPVPGAMPRSPRRRTPPPTQPAALPTRSGPSSTIPSMPSPAHTPVTLHAPSTTETQTKPLYPPLHPALSKRSEPIRNLFETPSSKAPSGAPVPITIPKGQIPSPSVKELAKSFEDEGVLDRLYSGKGKEKEGSLRRVQSRDL